MDLRAVVRPVGAGEEAGFQALMQAHHYFGALPKIGHTLWYVATWREQSLALLSFSAAAWKCAALRSLAAAPTAMLINLEEAFRPQTTQLYANGSLA